MCWIGIRGLKIRILNLKPNEIGYQKVEYVRLMVKTNN